MSDKPLTEGKTRGSVKPLRKGSNPSPLITRPPPPPSPPPNRLLREGDTGPYCHHCGSSFALRYMRKLNMCVQPKCDNYYNADFFGTRIDQETDDATITERLKRLCDDLDKSTDEMVGTSPYHTSVRVAVGIISSAIRKEFLK